MDCFAFKVSPLFDRNVWEYCCLIKILKFVFFVEISLLSWLFGGIKFCESCFWLIPKLQAWASVLLIRSFQVWDTKISCLRVIASINCVDALLIAAILTVLKHDGGLDIVILLLFSFIDHLVVICEELFGFWPLKTLPNIYGVSNDLSWILHRRCGVLSILTW